jgi:hypothetical protein
MINWNQKDPKGYYAHQRNRVKSQSNSCDTEQLNIWRLTCMQFFHLNFSKIIFCLKYYNIFIVPFTVSEIWGGQKEPIMLPIQGQDSMYICAGKYANIILKIKVKFCLKIRWLIEIKKTPRATMLTKEIESNLWILMFWVFNSNKVFTDEVRGLLENYNTIVSFISVKFIYCIISEGYGI